VAGSELLGKPGRVPQKSRGRVEGDAHNAAFICFDGERVACEAANAPGARLKEMVDV